MPTPPFQPPYRSVFSSEDRALIIRALKVAREEWRKTAACIPSVSDKYLADAGTLLRIIDEIEAE